MLVLDVVRGGPAEEAGLAPGDMIVALGSEPVGNLEEFLGALRRHDPGDEVVVGIVRDNSVRKSQ